MWWDKDAKLFLISSMPQNLPDTPPRKDAIKSQKDSIKQQQMEAGAYLTAEQQRYLSTELRKFQRRKQILFSRLEQKQLEEVRLVAHLFNDLLSAII